MGANPSNSKTHWETIYSNKQANEVSWYQEHAKASLQLIAGTGVGKNARIIDVGGGASVLVDDLLDEGYRDVTLLDISGVAIRNVQKRLGERAASVIWLEADITQVRLPDAAYDIWHDRAVFHFLTNVLDRELYVSAVKQALKPGGHVIIATFGSDGPFKCSGLDTMRYSPDELHAQFGDYFQLVDSVREVHHTPFGTEQSFVYCYCRRS
ncbi:MAG: class I SAM-dependent methyltransferase [Chloroflexota bacterium]|nr:class I SAM-dependent methyltransferase [Chloroflexota bacterium]